MTTVTPEQEYAAAQELAEALEERILAGDVSVSPGDLHEARSRAASLARFARLRQDAAVRREQERVEADRKAVRDEVRATLSPFIEAGRHRADGGPAAERARAAIEAALRELRASLDEAQQTFYAQMLRLQTGAGMEPGGPAVDGVGVTESRRVSLDGRTYLPPEGTQIARLIRDVAESAAKRALL